MMTEERSDMVIMVIPTQIFLEINESSIWILFTFSD